jgi:hypothetical protein
METLSLKKTACNKPGVDTPAAKKVVVLMVAKNFLENHPKSGQSTGFVQNLEKLKYHEGTKIHTIRKNYNYWAEKASQVNEGKAVLSIRYWSGRPRHSEQVEICRLGKMGLQKLTDPSNTLYATINNWPVRWECLAQNDGLSLEDFKAWFKNYPKTEPMAIIHFTQFRYNLDVEKWA